MPRANMWISAVLVLRENLTDLYTLYEWKSISLFGKMENN